MTPNSRPTPRRPKCQYFVRLFALLLIPLLSPLIIYMYPPRREHLYTPTETVSPECTCELPSGPEGGLSREDAVELEYRVFEPVKSGSLLDFHRLPLHKPGVSAWQQSSSDIDRHNKDFSKFLTIYDDNVTLMEYYGSGCIQRTYLAFTSLVDLRKMMRWLIIIEIDGDIALKTELRNIGRGQFKPFYFPLSGSVDPRSGFYSYVPIFFRQSCKISIQTLDFNYLNITVPQQKRSRGLYYAFTLHRYNFDTDRNEYPVFKGPQENVVELMKEVNKYLRNRFLDCPPPIANLTVGTKIIKDNQPRIKIGRNLIASHYGHGAIIGLYLKLTDAFQEHYRDIDIEIVFDSLEDTKIFSPVDLFFGTEGGAYESSSIAVGFLESCGGYMLFPMPFWSGFKISLLVPTRLGKTKLPSYHLRLDVTKTIYPKYKTGYFSTQVNIGRPLLHGIPHPILDTKGRWGHLVGNFLHMSRTSNQSTDSGQPYEGNDSTFIDGSLSAQIAGTSTHDYYNVANFFGWMSNISFPFHGVPKFIYYGDTHYYANCYRMLILDYVPFHNEIKIYLDHGPTFILSLKANYTSIAYFYAGLVPTIALCDEIDISDEHSLKEHAYTYVEGINIGMRKPRRAFYEPPAKTQEVPSFNQYKGGIISFTVSITKINIGVMLRRHTSRTAKKFSLANDEIWIPAKYTTQKESLQIEIRPMFDSPGTDEGQSGVWSEAHYWVFCEVPLSST